MRGKDPLMLFCAPMGWITPAHAGKREHSHTRPYPAQDHPRPCGEKALADLPQMRELGSPPPMRGKGTYFFCPFKSCRITPAHAGKSRPLSGRADGAQDHPRPCGEKELHALQQDARKGSPPPMRGKVARRILRARAIGITPAHAGKRSCM